MHTRDTETVPPLLRKVERGIATLILDRPNQFNALSSSLIAELQKAFDEIREDKSIRVVILAASGRGFCSGHDLNEIRALGERQAIEDLFLQCSKMMASIASLPQPVIAKIHGVATAAGCQLVAACDLAIASDLARFATPGVNVGAFCATPSVALGRNVSRKHAMEMLLTAEMITAERAAEIGLINRVVKPEQLDVETDKLALLLTSKSALAIATGKRMFYAQLMLPLDEAYRLASHAIACDFMSPDGQEGVDAFLAKRAANFQ